MTLKLPLEMLPIETMLNLEVTKNQNVMKELYFEFLCRILNYASVDNVDIPFSTTVCFL